MAQFHFLVEIAHLDGRLWELERQDEAQETFAAAQLRYVGPGRYYWSRHSMPLNDDVTGKCLADRGYIRVYRYIKI